MKTHASCKLAAVLLIVTLGGGLSAPLIQGVSAGTHRLLARGAARAALTAHAAAWRSLPALQTVAQTSGTTWSQQAVLTTTVSNDLGTSVAVSQNLAIVGAMGTNVVVAFGRSGGTWTQQAVITAADSATNDEFGHSVALSGGTLVVGAPLHNHQYGAVYVFAYKSGAWTQEAELHPIQPIARGNFGESVAINGGTIVVGAPSGSAGGRVTPAAFVFAYNGSSWVEEAKLTASDGANGDAFGASVAVSGGTALIGAPGKNNLTGAVYVFTRSGTTWSQKTELAGPSSGGLFGAVALSGTTAVIGAPFNQGAAYVYVGSGSTWTQQATLPTPTGAQEFGAAVALNGDTVVIGALATLYDGTAYVFVNNAGSWSQQAALAAPPGPVYGGFGYAVGISGNTAVIGAPGSKTAYVFVRS